MPKFGARVAGLNELINLFDDLENQIGDALEDVLRETTERAHKEITSSTDPPYRTGFTRKSTGQEPGKELYSTLAWARIWEFGGQSAVADFIFPKTEWMSKPLYEAFDDADKRLGERFDIIVE